MKDTIKVTQFQYNGWPTVEGEVPEVTRGMIELVDQAQSFHNSQAFAEAGPIVVHCRYVIDDEIKRVLPGPSTCLHLLFNQIFSVLLVHLVREPIAVQYLLH